VCICQASVAPHSNVAHMLSLFFRDDIMAWALKRSGRSSISAAGLSTKKLKSLVELNTAECAHRLQQVGDICFAFAKAYISSKLIHDIKEY
jgi:transformation/transcription domain-associated protein